MILISKIRLLIIIMLTGIVTYSCGSGKKDQPGADQTGSQRHQQSSESGTKAEGTSSGEEQQQTPESGQAQGTSASTSGEFRMTEHPPVPGDRGTEQPVPDDQATAIKQEMFREACLNGMSGEVQNYLREGADPDAVDADGRTGLMLAAYNGHNEIVKMLLDRNIEVNRTDGMGRTALMYASTGHFPATVEALLAHDADPNITDFEEGFTALMFAAAEGNREVVKLLLDHGADPDLKDIDGDTAGDFARQNGHMEVAGLLGG